MIGSWGFFGQVNASKKQKSCHSTNNSIGCLAFFLLFF